MKMQHTISAPAAGDEVGTHYDAMLAKVIAWAPTREQAARRLAGVLERARIHGVTTNRDQLVAVLRDEEFLTGELSTALLAERDWTRRPPDRWAAVAAALALAEHDRARAAVQRGIPAGWRNVVSQPQVTRFEDDVEVAWHGTRSGYAIDGATVRTATQGRVVLEVDGVTTPVDVLVDATDPVVRRVHLDGPGWSVSFDEVPRFVDPAEQVSAGSLLAPMPGTVVAVPVVAGASVVAGEVVLVLEAMKMQHAIKAPTDGVVAIEVGVGDQVAAGDVLAVVSGSESGEEDG
jgi:propionyl-CoA carboxylase alpha chain